MEISVGQAFQPDENDIDIEKCLNQTVFALFCPQIAQICADFRIPNLRKSAKSVDHFRVADLCRAFAFVTRSFSIPKGTT
jgi:hypothetical protein